MTESADEVAWEIKSRDYRLIDIVCNGAESDWRIDFYERTSHTSVIVAGNLDAFRELFKYADANVLIDDGYRPDDWRSQCKSLIETAIEQYHETTEKLDDSTG